MESHSTSPINLEGDDDDVSMKDTSIPGQSECHEDGVKKEELRKKRRLSSGVWSHFRILPAKPNEQLYCECIKCKKKYLADSKMGTGNLIRHMKTCIKMTTKDIGQYMLTSDKDSSTSTRSSDFRQEKFRELLVHAIIRHDLPFSFVEYEGIRNVFSYLEPKITHISRNTGKSDINKLHVKESERLRRELAACTSRICLTSDAWSSIVTDGYLSLTAHYIDSKWTLQKKILNFSYFPPPHNGAALCETIFGLVRDWGFEKKLFSITLDNASSNVACVDLLKQKLLLNQALVYDGNLFHVRYCAHSLFDEYASKSSPSATGSRINNESTSRSIGNEDDASSNVFKEFDEFEGFEFGNSAPKSQLEQYLDEPRTKRTSSIHILEFWRSQQFRYPDLTRLAMDVLCVPVSTVAFESAFSIGGRILDQYRSTMSPNVVEAVICCRDWLFGAPGIVEMPLEEITQDIMALNFNKDAVESIGEASSSKI